MEVVVVFGTCLRVCSNSLSFEMLGAKGRDNFDCGHKSVQCFVHDDTNNTRQYKAISARFPEPSLVNIFLIRLNLKLFAFGRAVSGFKEAPI